MSFRVDLILQLKVSAGDFSDAFRGSAFCVAGGFHAVEPLVRRTAERNGILCLVVKFVQDALIGTEQPE